MIWFSWCVYQKKIVKIDIGKIANEFIIKNGSRKKRFSLLQAS